LRVGWQIGQTKQRRPNKGERGVPMHAGHGHRTAKVGGRLRAR
jgi:hypothetical protein